MSLLNKPKSEMTPEELQKREEEEFNTGPLSVLTQSVKSNTQVLVNCRNNKKLLGRVKAFDRIWQYVQPASQPQTTCNHSSPGPPHLGSSTAGSFERGCWGVLLSNEAILCGKTHSDWVGLCPQRPTHGFTPAQSCEIHRLGPNEGPLYKQ
uniref:Small nuclear ribonucleoprotein Sm D2 n=1 Tax=Hucho hucho TaxID=62062 RepID=A0A4W5PAZ7_9TELE